MVSKVYNTKGIILSRKNFGEADRIIKIYTQKFGKVGVIAKGVRRPTSKKRGHLEMFSMVELQATVSNDLGILTEVQSVNSFEKLRKNLKKVALAYYFCEVIEKITREHEEHSELFYLLNDYLNKVQVGGNLKELRKEFVTKLLVLLGYWPAGKLMTDPDRELDDVLEREINTVKIGMKLIS